LLYLYFLLISLRTVYFIYKILFYKRIVSIILSGRFIMNVKLFLIMGMSWIWEMVLFFLTIHLPDEDWLHVFLYITDIFNCLQGVLIFILFVLKNRVYQALRERLGLNNKEEEIQLDVRRPWFYTILIELGKARVAVR